MDLQKIKHAGLITIPSLFTVGNICCGFFSILSSFGGYYSRAGWLVFAAMVLDAFDGRVARLLHAESPFGVEMDSLADLISFCAAPAILIYFIALEDTPFGAAIAFMFLLFGAIRLARFNVSAQENKGSKKYFSGLPTPAAAAVLASFAISYDIFALDAGGRMSPLMSAYLPYIYSTIAFITVALSLLMVSGIPYAAFKGGAGNTKKKITLTKLVLIVFVLALFVKYPQDIVFIVFGIYALMGIVMFFFRAFKHLEEKNS